MHEGPCDCLSEFNFYICNAVKAYKPIHSTTLQIIFSQTINSVVAAMSSQQGRQPRVCLQPVIKYEITSHSRFTAPAVFREELSIKPRLAENFVDSIKSKEKLKNGPILHGSMTSQKKFSARVVFSRSEFQSSCERQLQRVCDVTCFCLAAASCPR